MLDGVANTVPILDKGYVQLVEVHGTDLTVVNAARASFAKRSEQLSSGDERLISFLIENHHTSPFRHAFVTLEVKAPLLVARQWWRYVVGSDHTMDGWNEASRRYITMEPEFYVPTEWRSAPENKKQGSGAPVNRYIASDYTNYMKYTIQNGLAYYESAIKDGIAPEQARCFLPMYAMYTNWWWSASLQSVMHFLQERLADEAQKEIQEYARAVKELVLPYFPLSLKHLVDA